MLYRKIDRDTPSLFLDEMDNFALDEKREGSEAHAAQLLDTYLRAGEARSEDEARAVEALTGASTGASQTRVA